MLKTVDMREASLSAMQVEQILTEQVGQVKQARQVKQVEQVAFIAYSRRAVPGNELGHESWSVFVCKAGE